VRVRVGEGDESQGIRTVVTIEIIQRWWGIVSRSDNDARGWGGIEGRRGGGGVGCRSRDLYA